MSFDLNLIRRFEAVYRLRSFSRAAKELGMTHSAITKSIRTLEESWNVRLFDRTTRSVLPTEAGQRLAITAADLLAYGQNIKASVQSLEQKLTIICGPAIIDTFMHGALVLFRQVHPEIQVHIETMPPARASEQLIQRRAHLMLFHPTAVEGLADRKLLKVQTLGSEPYLAVFRPGHPVEQSDQSLETMLAFDWAVAGFDTSYQSGLPPKQLELYQRFGFPKYRVLNQSVCIEMVSKTDLLTVLPATAAKPHLASGHLKAVPYPDGARFSMSAITLANGEPSTAVTDFITAIEQSWAPGISA
jgi:DNA-binding transcriptional LysR family regulator